MSLTFQEIREGATYEMAVGDGLGGIHYSVGDPVLILSKIPASPFYCKNLRTGDPFYASGASSFRTRGEAS